MANILNIPIVWNLVQFVFGCDEQKRNMYRTAFGSPGRILDFGCADGNTFPAFTDFDYYGIDINDKLLNYARKKYSTFKNARFINANILDKPFSPEFFDYTLFACTGHHLKETDFLKIMDSLIDTLKKGGSLHIFDTIRCPEKDSKILQFIINMDQGKFMKDEDEYKSILNKLSDKLELVKKETFKVKNIMPLPMFFHAELKKI